MKKLLNTLLVFIILLSFCIPVSADYSGTVNPESVLLINVNTGETLYSKNSNDSVWPASTTKIMTALVIIENTPLTNSFTACESALYGISEGDDSTLVPMLKDGEQMSVLDLLYGMMLISGNDCAYVLADCLDGAPDGNVEKCVSLMNDKAKELGMNDTHFSNPCGVQDEDHYTTAEDMAKLAQAALENDTLMDIVGTSTYSISATAVSGERQIITTNRLLLAQDDLPGTEYLYATGMKTGYTPSSGGCLVASAEKDGTQILCLIFGDDSDAQQERWLLAKDMLRYGLGEDSVTNLSASSTSPVSSQVTESEPDSQAVLDASGNGEIDSSLTAENETELSESTSPSQISEKKHMAVWLKIILTIILLVVIAFLGLLLYTRVQSIRLHNKKLASKGRQVTKKRDYPGFVMAAVLAVFAILLIVVLSSCGKTQKTELPESTEPEPVEIIETPAVHNTEDTAPANWGITWQIGKSGNPASSSTKTEWLESYTRESPVSFSDDNYFSLKGVCTFRGNNYRNSATYGTAQVSDEMMYTGWTASTTSLGTWTGSGWTGQPLIVQWDKQTISHMNICESKKAKENLVEVIYATLDGHIYFLDLDDGEATRDPIELGMPFKGSGALDPRGYPILYVGSGDEQDDKHPHAYIINLLDGSVMLEFGNNETDFSLRTDHNNWSAFDSSPLVYAEGDLLIWPGENGILYTMKLNTSYNAATGSLSIQPDEVIKTRYNTARSNTETYWYGYESSAVIAEHYLYISENGGMFFCIDLNSMELIWAQETNDDSNSTPVYEIDENGRGYIYTAPSLHWTAEDGEGYTYIYKLDAMTGEYVWAHSYPCFTVDGVSGGVQSTPLLGKTGTELEGMIIYTIARTPNVSDGLIVAIDTENGCEVWRTYMDNYTWSSPAAFYTEEGNAYIVVCDSVGNAFLLNGSTGEQLDRCDVGTLVEASPAIYEDKLVVGTRGMEIYMLYIE